MPARIFALAGFLGAPGRAPPPGGANPIGRKPVRTGGEAGATHARHPLGASSSLKTNEDVREFYLGLTVEGERKSFRDMKHYRNLVNYYTNKNISVSYLRAKKKHDLDRVLKLYGKGAEKYW